MAEDDGSLYYRLGGETAIISLVDQFYENVLADDSLRNFFHNVSMDRLKRMQKEFFSIALGGPGVFSDFSLSLVHQGRNIKTSHFSRFVDILFSTLADQDITDEERFQIISRVNTYVDDIVDNSDSLIN